MARTMEGFGNRRVQYSKGEELFEDELDRLKTWIDDHWQDWMPNYGLKAQPEIGLLGTGQGNELVIVSCRVIGL